MPTRHIYTSAIADGGDSTLVQPSNWNADHLDAYIPNAFMELALAGAARMTVTSTQRVALSDRPLDPSLLKYRAPGSAALMPDEYTLDINRTALYGSARRTMVGNARAILTDLTPGGRLVLAGRGG